MTKKELWLTIKNYHFTDLVPPNLWQNISQKFGGDDASTKAFATKIARKLHWKYRFARKATWEYKKFIYLGIVSDFQVTPSRIIDQVWHEHVLFTRAYREFCTEVIRYPFDHNPELMPDPKMTGIFQAQYLDTIELYKKEFGIDPHAAFWGEPKFGCDETLPNPFTSTKKTGSLKNAGSINDDTPLVTYFAYDMVLGDGNDFTEFNGGDYGGAGAEGSWDSVDAGSDSSDSGSSGSSCSSGCGGGGD